MRQLFEYWLSCKTSDHLDKWDLTFQVTIHIMGNTKVTTGGQNRARSGNERRHTVTANSYMSGIRLKALRTCFHLTILQSKYCYEPPFTKETTEAWRGFSSRTGIGVCVSRAWLSSSPRHCHAEEGLILRSSMWSEQMLAQRSFLPRITPLLAPGVKGRQNEGKTKLYPSLPWFHWMRVPQISSKIRLRTWLTVRVVKC